MKRDHFFEMSALWPLGTSAKSDVAEIRLRLGEHVLSRVADVEKQTTRDFFRASATTLGLWFVDNWWRLRWETLTDPRYPSVDWRLRHELNSASGGALWPPVMIYSVGDRLVFAPSIGRRPVSGPQQYLDFPISTVAASEYEAELDRFLSTVLGECAPSSDAKAMKDIWVQIQSERADLELAGWRRLEACLGYDPDQAPDAVVDGLIDLEDLVGEKGLEEAALAKPGAEAAKALECAIDAARESTLKVDLRIVGDLSPRPVWAENASPWRFAEEAASNLRGLIGIKRGPLKRDDYANIFRARWRDLKESTATARELPYGARLSGDDGSDRLAMQTWATHDRRFELARLLGDSIWSNESKFGVVSRARTDRQKFQRAFAQSLLCPFDDLRTIVDMNAPTEEQINEAARLYHVHVNVVRNLLVYKGILPFETLEERLEAA